MRKLYLHIGCGKTGSSALQIWMANNRENLCSQNILYPFRSGITLKDYEITSGNGLELVNHIKSKNADAIIAANVKHGDHDILFSSEIFQTLEVGHLSHLRDLALKYHLDVHIIAFVRDVYDMAYSTYLQHLKRHGYDKSFQEYAMTLNTLMQFQVVENFSKYFKNIHLLHYEAEKNNGIEKALCRCLGINAQSLPAMPQKKVNRSLTFFESQLLLLFNQQYKKSFGSSDAEMFSTIISDRILQENPERETEIYFDEQVCNHLQNTMGSCVESFNATYFHGRGIHIFNPEGKNILQDAPPVSDELRALVAALFAGLLFRLNTSQQIIHFKNKMIDTLRDTALSLEDTAVNQAYILMRAAQHFRKNGPLINQKVREYGVRLNAAKAAPPPVPGKS
jgi:hypothetical protein